MSLSFLLDGVDETERQARLRELRAIVRLLCGSSHPASVIFDYTVKGSFDTAKALSAIDLLPARQRRDILSTFGALTWPNNRKLKINTKDKHCE